jgi:hypothetical protein
MNQLIFQGLLTLLVTTLPFINASAQPKKAQLSDRVSVEFPGQFRRLQMESIIIYQFKDSTGTYRAIVSDVESAGIYAQEIKEEMPKPAFWDDYIEVLPRKMNFEGTLTQRKLKKVNGMEVMELIFEGLAEEEAPDEKSHIAVAAFFDGTVLFEIMYMNDGAATDSVSKQKFLNSLQIKQNQ